jgi:hypothetical protein
VLAATAVWFWPLVFVLLVGGLLRLLVAGRRGVSGTSPLIAAHRGAFTVGVVVLIGAALAWLIAQSVS